MLVIRHAQIAAFGDAAVDAYVLELAAHCREYSPRLCKTLPDEDLTAAIRHGLKAAEAAGFTRRGPVRLYVDLMISLGSGFATDPQYPWAAAIIGANDGATEMERAHALYEKTHEYLSQVDGKNNVHTLEALAGLSAWHASGLVFRADTLESDLLRVMTELHPRKVAAAGTPGLTRLIADGLERGRARYAFTSPRALALLVVLMFAFGHQFDDDPLLPWIGRTLRRVHGGPDAGAEHLERRAMTWLSAVLENAGGD